MVWKKLGLIFDARTELPSWAANSALTPTPYLHPRGFIRIYAGFRDHEGVSRIGYVDVSSEDPTRVLGVSARPALDIGRAGCFDDNGVILGDVLSHAGSLWMFYVGFQRVAKAKFIALTGLARSDDGGDTFTRCSEGPFLGRADGQTMIAAVHSVMFEQGQLRLWYAAGNDWETIQGRPFPQYEVKHLMLPGMTPSAGVGTLCVAPERPEYRAGRPRVYRQADGYLMHFTRGTTEGDYTPAVATSVDGVMWQRQPGFPLALSADGWDSRHLCYPVMLEASGRRYMFYNGNDMGLDGIGCAVETVTAACV